MAASGHKFLITGATGFLGSALCDRLAKRGDDIVGCGRTAPQALNYPVFACDLSKPDQACDLVAGVNPTVVIHLAGLVDGTSEPALVRPTFDANVVTTVNLLEALRLNGAARRILLAGSVEEEPANATRSPYAVSKAAAALYAEYYRNCIQLPVVRAIFSFVYGPGQKANRLIPYLIGCALDGREPVLRNPERGCDFIYIADAVERLIHYSEAAGEYANVNIVSGKTVTVADLIPAIACAVRRGRLNGMDLSDRSRSDGVTAECACWEPATSLATGLLHTVDWVRRQRSFV